jgi:EAL domain-containing protein (putative c-di-GMP-specific phosphodiesterase class I)
MRNLQDPSLPLQIKELLERWQVPPHLLKVEVTESGIMANPMQAMEMATLLSQRAVDLHLDDFGTGYSSLSQIKRLPVRGLKIDRSFVIDMAQDEDDAAIVRSTIELGHNRLLVVAEGVETRETWDLLRAAGCDIAQGNFVCRPLRADELERWLEGCNNQAPAYV